jgi:exopolysaccharide biosynthesis protein
MSNKEQLQNNNAEYSALIEVLKGKAVGGGNVDLSAYATKEELNNYQPKGNYATTEQLETKQPKGEYLTEHQPLKTINGQSLVGEGNITIEGGNGETVDLSGYQEKLISGTNIKTINGQSILGGGNIEIGGTSQSGKTSFDEFLDNIDVDYAYDSATGANYTVIRVYKNKLDGTKQYPFAVVPDVNEIKYSTLDFMEKFADDNGYLLAINSGLGSPATHQIDGIVVQNGVVVYNTPAVYHAGSMPLTIDVNGDLSYASSNVDANELVANGVVSALCGFCPIIVDYNTVNPPTVSNVTHFTQNAQRQIIGQFGNGDYAIVTCEGRDFDNSDGWTIAEAQTICKKLGLKFAYNLDGGGSTQTVIGKKQLNTIYENEKGRKLPSFIVFNGKTELGVMPDVPDIPTKTLESITATYNGGSVAVGTDLTTLTGIVVTATYSDGSTAIVNGYTLSGEIVEGDNVITVKYSSKTTTITVVGVALSEFIWTIGTTEPNGTWLGQGGPEYHRTALYTTENTGSQVALDIDNNSVVNSHNVPYGAPKKLYLPKIPTGATKLSWSNSDANVFEAIWLYDATGTRITEVGTKYDMASPLDLTKYPNAVYWNCDCKYGTKNATIYANPDSSLPDAYARYQIICDTEFTFS